VEAGDCRIKGDLEISVTATARKILADCETAHELLETESDAVRFRLLWVSGVALLCSVGHKLQKVDSRRDPQAKEAIEEAWKRWKSDREAHAIFWEFIEEERNNILKEYEFGFLSGPIEILVVPGNELFTLDEELFCPIASGRFAGQDARNVLAEGIEW
jgi:hypothetical protein